jgi:hypothetical protein
MSERFVNGLPQSESVPSTVWINRNEKIRHQDRSGMTIASPDATEVVPTRSSYEHLRNGERRDVGQGCR